MSEKTKIVVTLMFSIIIIYIAWMIAFPGDVAEEKPSEINSGEEVNKNNEENEYTISRVSDTQLDLITENEYTKTTTRYLFENDKVTSVIIVEEILSGDLADEVFNGIKANEEMSQIYSDIKLEENVVTMILKEDYVNVYEGLNYEQLYQELTNSLKISQE